jgi:protein ImuB
MLWIALELPSLPLQLAERGSCSPTPLVIADGAAQRPHVACANAAARGAGVREGVAVAAAKALAGDLRILARDPGRERAALEDLAGWAAQYSSCVSVDGQGIALEVGPSLKLFGGLGKLSGTVRDGVRALGYRATLGIAPTPLAARLFARAEAQGIRVRSCVAVGELGNRIAGLPLFLLDWPARSLALLADLGILRFRDLLALPREGLARRFGPQVVEDIDKALGRLPDPRIPHVAPERFLARLELAHETHSAEALLFPLRRLLVQMEGFLRGRGAGVMSLAMGLEPFRGARTGLSLQFASPEREAEFILALVREKLARIRISAPTLTVELRADELVPFMPRSSTWLPGREEQAIGCERLLQRLAARLGREKVFGIALADDHRPGRDWAPADAGVSARCHSREACPRVTLSGGGNPISGPRPFWLLLRAQKLVTEAGSPQLQGRLDMLSGPERIEAGWWDGMTVARDYHVAANPRGETYWIYREHEDPSGWYVHGVFS